MKLIWEVAALFTLALVVGGAYSILNSESRPQPLTIEQCRDLAKDSDALKKLFAGYGMTDADRETTSELAAIRCFVDHNSDTSSWPNDRKIQVVFYRFCSAKANEQLGKFAQSGTITGNDDFAEAFRRSFQRSRVASAIESAKNEK